jgi:hypothetical protein
MRPLPDLYAELFTPQELTEMQEFALKELKRAETWDRPAACKAWLSSIIYMMLKKGLLRSLNAIESETKEGA